MSETIERQTMAGFIARYGVRMTVAQTDRNPGMGDDMDHWRCTLRRERRQTVVLFSMGRGHYGAEPKLADVLSCMASDCSGMENARGFDDWCGEYGYDTDSRKAERIYRACKRQVAKLFRLLGREAYDALLWHTEQE